VTNRAIFCRISFMIAIEANQVSFELIGPIYAKQG
jgi:hypothetical protein